MTDTSLPVGMIEWEITDAQTRQIISRGSRALNLDDIKVVPIVPRRHSRFLMLLFPLLREESMKSRYNKQIQLENGFFINLVEVPTRDLQERLGFGIVAGRHSRPTSSWEWFNVDAEEHATKIQERGELGIKVEKGKTGWELTSTEFLTDISLRICLFSTGRRAALTHMKSLLQPQWRIRIFKGSYVPKFRPK